MEAEASIASTESVRTDTDLFGHPRGLIVLAGTEFWDRISFHGMQALLVLYMAEQLLLPGHVEHVVGIAAFRSVIEAVTGPLSNQALATQIFGVYVGLVYFTPLFGGVLGDRLLGRFHTVALGAILMSAGHFCMAFDRSFLLALLLLVLGAGCLRGNLMSQVGALYSTEDRRRDDGFQIYFALLNGGAFFAPLVSGALAQAYGWHYGFGFAGFGMLVGLSVYVAGRRHVLADVPRSRRLTRVGLSAADRRAVLALCLMLPLLSLFWIAQSQVWNTYNLWARDHLDLMIASWKIPVAWMQAVDFLTAVIFVPPIVLFWRWQARRGREPDDFTKLSIGCLIFGLSMAWLAAGAGFANAAGKVSLAWALGFHLIDAIGYLYVGPVAVALFSRSAPPNVNAMMVSVYYLSIFAGSTISGRLGGLYERLSASQFWLLHATIVGSGGLLILLFAPLLKRMLNYRHQVSAGAAAPAHG